MPLWTFLLGATILLVWQGWLTQQLFGSDPLERLLNEEPLVTGTHPQNLYLGVRGAQALAGQGRTCVYDHSFQAGYPITPIFDGGRLAELFILLGGGSYQPAAYKVGLASLCMMVPLFLILAAKTVGLGSTATLLATLVGQIVWWGPHGRGALETGDCQVYLASLAILSHVGLLVAYHRTASVWAWLGLGITACMGWFLQPLLFPIALPMLLVYYLTVGVKHDFLTWHIALWVVELVAILINLPWLLDWLDSWWLRASLPLNPDLLIHRTFATVWHAPLWGGSTDRMLALMLLGSAAVGVLILNHSQQRAAARLLGMGTTGALILALLGISWEPLGTVGMAVLLAPALWFACLPAAHAWMRLAGWLWEFGKLGKVVLAFLLLNTGAGFLLFTDTPHDLFERGLHTDPLVIGLNPERRELVDFLMQYTSSDARILWEDRARPRQASRWSALLPLLTQRDFIGGLDPDGFIEHSSISLMNQALDGRPITTWSHAELLEYCRRYNVRWIVAWSPAVIQHLEQWPALIRCKEVHDGETGCLFEVQRKAEFALKGSAELLHTDGQDITLGDVVPSGGEVILSLHYQAGMRASNERVHIERAASGDDPIGFIRLRLAVTVRRITLSWQR